jgi:hypothetical protein
MSMLNFVFTDGNTMVRETGGLVSLSLFQRRGLVPLSAYLLGNIKVATRYLRDPDRTQVSGLFDIKLSTTCAWIARRPPRSI